MHTLSPLGSFVHLFGLTRQHLWKKESFLLLAFHVRSIPFYRCIRAGTEADLVVFSTLLLQTMMYKCDHNCRIHFKYILSGCDTCHVCEIILACLIWSKGGQRLPANPKCAELGLVWVYVVTQLGCMWWWCSHPSTQLGNSRGGCALKSKPGSSSLTLWLPSLPLLSPLTSHPQEALPSSYQHSDMTVIASYTYLMPHTPDLRWNKFSGTVSHTF